MEEYPSYFFFDPSGDLKLEVDEDDRQREFVVSAKAMCLASSVWRAMLDPSGFFTEGQPVKGRLAFPEDSAETMHLLLAIVHYQFQLIPPSLEYEELLNLAISCNKYYTVDLLYPWLSNWLEGLRAVAHHPGKEGSLFISWVFRDASIFECVAEKLVKEVSIDESGEWITKHDEGREVLEHYMPPGVIESILKARLATIKSLLDVCGSFSARFTTSKESYICEGHYDQAECDAMTYGCFIRALETAELKQSLPPPSDIKRSAEELVTF